MAWHGIPFNEIPRKVTGAYLLADLSHSQLKVTKTGHGLHIGLPKRALDQIANVLVLTTG